MSNELELPDNEIELVFIPFSEEDKARWNSIKEGIAACMDKRMKENPGFIPEKELCIESIQT